MIRFSALLVALAIGLLAAGVAASSLPLVYVSIAVCAVAALLLAAGVLRHWAEIFGPRAQRAASPFAASGPVPSPATAGRACRPPGGSRGSGAAGSRRHSGPGQPGGRSGSGRFPGRRWGWPSGPAAGTGRRGRPVPGRRRSGWPGRPGPSRSGRPRGQRGPGVGGQDEADSAARADRRSGRKGWPARRPAEPEPEPAPAPAEPIHAAATDDLWDRVNEELESAGKRDSAGCPGLPATSRSRPGCRCRPSRRSRRRSPGPAGQVAGTYGSLPRLAAAQHAAEQLAVRTVRGTGQRRTGRPGQRPRNRYRGSRPRHRRRR